MNRIARLTLLTVGLAALILLVGLLWLWKTRGSTVSTPDAPEIPAALKNAREAAGKTALEGEAAREKDLWKARYPELEPSDLVVLPMRDETRLRGTWNFELREYPAYLIPALMYLGGRPVRCPDSWPVAAALSRQDISFFSPKPLSAEGLLELGKSLRTRQIVQIIIDRDREAGKTIASATGVDVSTGALLGPWQTLVETERNTYEALYAVENSLSRRIAADLCGLADESDLFRKPPGGGGDSPKAKQALDEIFIFNFPRLMRAYRLALEAIEETPHSARAWTSASMVAMLLADRVAWGEEQSWREMTMRAMVAGEIARTLDPEYPYARLARTFSLAVEGRVAEAIQRTEADIAAYSEEPLDQVMLEALWGRCEIPCPTGTPSLWCYLMGLPGAGQREDEPRPYADLEELLQHEPFAPDLWMTFANEGDLSISRQCHTLAVVQGSALALAELVRQLELSGQGEAAGEVMDSLGGLLGMVMAIPRSATGTPRADLLDEYLEEWALGYGLPQVTFMDIFWGKDTFPYRMLELYAKARKKTIPKKLDRATLRASAHGLALTPVQWVELAERPAIGGTIDTVMDLIDRLSDKPSGQRFAIDLGRFFPEDLAVLNILALIHYVHVFTPPKVDFYQNAMFAIDPTYNKARRRNVVLGSKNERRFVRQLEELKTFAPFHNRTLRFIQNQLASLGDYARAADYAELIGIRYPAGYSVKVKAIRLRAKAEDRSLSAEDVARIEELYPECYADREWILADVYSDARRFDQAIALYEKLLAEVEIEDPASYRALVWLYQLQGRTDEALETLERFVERVPDRLNTVGVLCDKAGVYLSQGDLESARREWRRAADIDDWKADSLSMQATLLWLEGKHEESIQVLRRKAERYPGAGTFSTLGWRYLAVGDFDSAMRLADEGIRRWEGTNPLGCYKIKLELLRRQGRSTEALSILEDRLRRAPHVAGNYQMLAQHHLIAGNLGQAIRYAEQFLEQSWSNKRADAWTLLVECLILNGDFERAEQEIAKYEAHYPLYHLGWRMRALLALHRGEPEEALAHLGVPENLGKRYAYVMQAQAYLDLGQADKALEKARWATRLRNPFMEEAWLTLGKAALATGDTKLAREALQTCIEEDGKDDFYGRQAAQLLETLR